MTTTVRPYRHPDDFGPVGQFLMNTYRTGNGHRNWLQPRWEYMLYHPALDQQTLDRIGVWEESGEIVAVLHHEHSLGTVYFEVAPGYSHLKTEMVEYAEAHLIGEEKGQRFLQCFVDRTDSDLQAAVAGMGYEKKVQWAEPMSMLPIPVAFPAITLPDGFLVKSLAEDNDLARVHRALHRGFNHEGEPPEDEIDGRRLMQSAPNFRKDLNIVVEAPSGYFVSYSGTWYDPLNRACYVEPVATDPGYRRLGLGTAAVLEGIRRCGTEGATVAYVGSDQEFYKSMGFETVYTQYVWEKRM
jgi:ribosomal protein S18 acetylase RimI-like enzyme